MVNGKLDIDLEPVTELHRLIRIYGFDEWREGVEAQNDQSRSHEKAMAQTRDSFKAITDHLEKMFSL